MQLLHYDFTNGTLQNVMLTHPKFKGNTFSTTWTEQYMLLKTIRLMFDENEKLLK